MRVIPYMWLASALFTAGGVLASGLRFSSPMAIAIAWVETFLLIALVGGFRSLLRPWLSLLVLLSGAGAILLRQYGIEFSPSIFETLLTTNPDETRSFVSKELVALWLAYTLIPLGALLWFKPFGGWELSLRSRPSGRVFAEVFVSALLVVGVLQGTRQWNLPEASRAQKKEVNRFALPLGILVQGVDFWRDRSNYEMIPLKDRVRVEELGGFVAQQGKTPAQPHWVVLIIGESQRGDHLSINGYGRPTTPQMDQIPHVVTYTDVTSCSARTVFSVSCLLSHRGIEKFDLPVRETSLVSVMKSLGYETYFVSQHLKKGLQNCMEADHCLMGSDLQRVTPQSGAGETDFRLLDYWDQTFSAAQSVQKNRFVILHAMGSHFNYHERFPREGWTPPFTPYCQDPIYRCKTDELINAYDNSLAYFDEFFMALVKRLSGQRAMLLFTSDHGESLGEGGVFTHGKPNFLAPKEQRHVPLVFWASDLLVQEQRLQSEFKRRVRSEPMTHDAVFQSILGCLGVRSSLFPKYPQSICQI